MKVGELASGEVIGVEPGRSLRAAAEVMWERNVGSVVVQREGKLVGILTERDTLRAMAAYVDPDQTPVERLMTTEVCTVTPDWDVYEAAAEMSAHRIRHLVLQSDGKVVGVLSMRDVLLAGQRVELANGSWAILRDPLTFTVRERRVLHRYLQKLRGANPNADVDDILGLLVGSWSFDEAVPGDSDGLRSIPEVDFETLRDAVVTRLPDLQRAVHPAPGFRKRNKGAGRGERRPKRGITGDRKGAHHERA
ncbi:hypothetical protein BH20ACT23_BH20ACT23_18170 [soil metagenome]